MNIAAWWLLLVPMWPGVLAVAVLLAPRRGLAGAFAVAGAVPALVVGVQPAVFTETSYSWLLLGTRFGVGAVDALFLFFTAVVWLVSATFAHGWIRSPGRERFFVFFLLAMAGNLGALVAQDLPSFYACFALMSFAAFGVIVHTGTPQARHAGSVYIVLVLIGEAALALALVLAAGALRVTDFAAVRAGLAGLPHPHLIVALAVLGFGIKAGAPILHVWLPLAHPVAPAPASAVLSGTMIVTGLVGWLRFLPVGELAMPVWGGSFVIAGLAGAFYGAFVGLDQRDPKVVLAYSSVSQMGIMTVGVGSILLAPGLAGPLSAAIAFFALHHGLAKSSLFLGAGLASVSMDTDRRRLLVSGLALPSLALAGAPLTSGMLAKSALVAGDAVLPEGWASLLHVALPLTSVATALLMLRFLVLVYRRRGAAGARPDRGPWMTWSVSVALAVVLPWWFRPTAPAPVAEQALNSAWPLGAALVLALAGIWVWRRAGRPAIPAIPEGDVLSPLERSFAVVRRVVVAATEQSNTWRDTCRQRAAAGRHRAWLVIQDTRRAEVLLNRWQVALTLAVLLGSVIALLAMG